MRNLAGLVVFAVKKGSGSLVSSCARNHTGTFSIVECVHRSSMVLLSGLAIVPPQTPGAGRSVPLLCNAVKHILRHYLAHLGLSGPPDLTGVSDKPNY